MRLHTLGLEMKIPFSISHRQLWTNHAKMQIRKRDRYAAEEERSMCEHLEYGSHNAGPHATRGWGLGNIEPGSVLFCGKTQLVQTEKGFSLLNGVGILHVAL